jgi:hypothetical protein
MAVREPLPESPINTSEYAAIADGFFAVEIHALSESRWLIRNRGAVQTLRLDDADSLELDPTRSKGAIGQNRHDHALYIALDAAVDEPIVALRRTSASDSGTVGLGDAGRKSLAISSTGHIPILSAILSKGLPPQDYLSGSDIYLHPSSIRYY